MSQATKIFPMTTFVAYLKGVEAQAHRANIKDLLSFMTKKDVSDAFFPFAAAMGKAWIYEQHPELASMKAEGVQGLGDNVSVMELPDDVLVEVDAIHARITGAAQELDELGTAKAELEGKLAEAQAKAAELEKAVGEYKGKCEAFEKSASGDGEKVFVAAQAKVDEYLGKVDELLKQIEDVKKHGVVTVAAGTAPAGAAPVADGPTESPGGVSSDFGFGTDSGGDGFGF